jgi:hypothetical protein
LHQVLSSQQSGDLLPHLEKLARINLHLCITLCCIATFEQLAQYGVTNHDFLLAALNVEKSNAESFLDKMQQGRLFDDPRRSRGISNFPGL